MADKVQVILPSELTPLINEIKAERVKKCEPSSNKSIVVDAVKNYHKKVFR